MTKYFLKYFYLLLAIGILGFIASCSPTTKSNSTLIPSTAISTAPAPDANTVTITSAPEITPTSFVSPTTEPPLNIPKNALIAYSGGSSINIVSAIGEIPIPIIENNIGISHYYSPSWSPTGDQITFIVDDPTSAKIYIINRDGTNLRLLRDNVKLGDPTWSPDGEHIAYTSDSGLYVTAAEGTSLQQVAKLRSFLFPAWSPDGKQLAILGDSEGIYGPFKIYLIDSNGKNLQVITRAIAGMSRLTWSPDGKEIAFRSYDGCGDINVLSLKTGVIRNLTNTPNQAELDPSWSADGNYIAFSRSSYTPCEQDKVHSYTGDGIFIMQSNGENVTQLTSGSTGFQPVWWPGTILRLDWKYKITKSGTNLNVRETYSLSAKSLMKLEQGVTFTALEETISSEGYNWRHIHTQDGIEGWIVDVPGWYMLESAP